jgi:DNA helicase-2/ATP-dependent DNA helicase PcrA
VTASRPDHDHDAVCTNAAAHRVVVAPPGTGKTHLAVRLAGTLAAELSDSPVPNTTTGARVLLLTFSNQARAQLEREAARQLDHSTRRRVVVSNYHSLFWSAVRSHRRALGLPERLQIVGTQQREQALSAAEPDTTRALRRHPGLLESLAEHEFEAFHDDRTPPPEQLAALLTAVTAEQHAGRLVFDDFGALFWRLLERFPTLATSYRARFPIVIADEHQDASALQDAVVRRLATQIKVILADPLQLIHGFRGARDERLDAHITEARHKFELRTPHRWHNQPDAGKWLLGVRERLLGD